MTDARPTPTVVLMGLRGSGKSTLGRALADRLARPFVDLDDRTARALGCETPGEALRAQGIDRFRAAEARALAATLEELENDPGVLALGGGTPTAPNAAGELAGRRAAGSVRIVYLAASPATLADRLRTPGAPDRPALTGADPIDEIAALHTQRDPLYRSLADAVLELDATTEHAALDALLASVAG